MLDVDILSLHKLIGTKMNSDSPSIEKLTILLREFAANRDWERYHSPKNLVMALAGEIGELSEHFQWLSEAESRSLSEKSLSEVKMEIADVFLYLLRLSDVLSVNLLTASSEKLELNAEKYPVNLAKGNAKKYTEL